MKEGGWKRAGRGAGRHSSSDLCHPYPSCVPMWPLSKAWRFPPLRLILTESGGPRETGACSEARRPHPPRLPCGGVTGPLPAQAPVSSWKGSRKSFHPKSIYQTGKLSPGEVTEPLTPEVSEQPAADMGWTRALGRTVALPSLGFPESVRAGPRLSPTRRRLALEHVSSLGQKKSRSCSRPPPKLPGGLRPIHKELAWDVKPWFSLQQAALLSP